MVKAGVRQRRPVTPLHYSLASPRTFKAEPSVRGADLTWGMEEWHLLSWRASRRCCRGRRAVARPQHAPPDPLSRPPAAAHVAGWCAWLTLWTSRSFSHAPAASSSVPAPGGKWLRCTRRGSTRPACIPPHTPLLHPAWTAPTPSVAGVPGSQGSQGRTGLCWCELGWDRVGDAHMPRVSREGCRAVCMWECLLRTAQV